MARPPDPERRAALGRAVAGYLEGRGLAGLSLRPLAAAVGVSPRTLLYHFGSKERLLAEALAASPALRSALDEFTGGTDPLFRRLRRLWERTVAPASRDYLRLFFEVYATSLRDPPRYAAFRETVVHPWLELLGPMLEQEGVPARDAARLATELLALHHGCALDLLVTGDLRRVERAYLGRLAELERRLADGSGEGASRPTRPSGTGSPGRRTR